MAVHHGAEVVEAVGQGQSLRVSVLFAHLLHTAVNVAEVRVYLLYNLAVEHGLQPEHAVGRGVLRANVHNEVVVGEQLVLLSLQVAVGVERILVRKVGFYVVVERISVVLRAHVIVLAERIAHKIAAQVEAAHVGVSEELDAEEIEHLALE